MLLLYLLLRIPNKVLVAENKVVGQHNRVSYLKVFLKKIKIHHYGVIASKSKWGPLYSLFFAFCFYILQVIPVERRERKLVINVVLLEDPYDYSG